MRPALAALVVCLSLAGICNRQVADLQMLIDPKEMKNEVLQRIPLGTRVNEARRTMEGNGFVCKDMENAAYVEYDENDEQIVHSGVDYLWCHKKSLAAPLVQREWHVILPHEEGKVSSIAVTVGLTGP